MEKIREPGGQEKMDVVRPSPLNVLPLTLTHYPHTDTRRKEKTRPSARDMEKESGKGA